MKTVLSRFCTEFESVVRPLLEPVREVGEVLGGVSADIPARAALPLLRDFDHRLTTLVEKVAAQQAYVLIFGPLKSGKSTLMNAIAASYVSEVTALPAYPCMVYVSHAPEVRYELSRYDGTRTVITDSDELDEAMRDAHAELADALRGAEAAGQVFEPATHCPTALRRVDVKVPAPELSESSAVLVDTPGLYSRMKFGYDRMTREFRDTAACAVFVVKTDNLFLEQVFDEFGQLLELFSRIFLVVNLDSTKRDLRPDGTLVTSLEGSDPERIVEAFEDLSMSAPLKRARDEGRLRIYAVDLLAAASQRLQSAAAGQSTLFAGDEAASSPADTCEVFLRDLTDYLNSTDYLIAFLRDSLRQAHRLFGEFDQLHASETVRGLVQRVASLEAEAETCADAGAALERLSAFAWRSAFDQLGTDLLSIADGRLEKRRDEVSARVAAELDRWFGSDDSFAALHDEYVGPVLRDVREDLAETVQGVLKTVSGNAGAGADLPDAIASDLGTVDLDLSGVGVAALAAQGQRPVAGGALRVTTAAVPVRRGFVDWLLLRRRATVRRRLFGPPEAPAKAVPAAVKARRLREAGRRELEAAFQTELQRFFDDELRSLARSWLDGYVHSLHQGIGERIDALRAENDHRAEVVARQLDETRQVQAALESLRVAVAARTTALRSLDQRYGDGTAGDGTPETDEAIGGDGVEGVTEAEIAAEADAEAATGAGADGEPVPARHPDETAG